MANGRARVCEELTKAQDKSPSDQRKIRTNSGLNAISITRSNSNMGRLSTGKTTAREPTTDPRRVSNKTRVKKYSYASLKQKTGEIKQVSVYRDTLMEMNDGSYNKTNAGYSYGGAQEAVSVLNRNLDLNIQNYVTVKFSALICVIDALGGFELTLTDEEVYWTNQYQCETAEIAGRAVDELIQAGIQTLNGLRATAFCRIRKTDGYAPSHEVTPISDNIACYGNEAGTTTNQIYNSSGYSQNSTYDRGGGIYRIRRMIHQPIIHRCMIIQDRIRIHQDKGRIHRTRPSRRRIHLEEQRIRI